MNLDQPSTLRETSTGHVRSIRKRRKPRVTYKIRKVWKKPTPPVKPVRDKLCYCHTCGTEIHFLGIASHRAKHRRNKENCSITYTNGQTTDYKFAD